MTKEQLQKLDAMAKPRSEEAIKKAEERKQRENELNLKVIIEIDDTLNVVCTIEKDGKVLKWENLDKCQQIQVINSLGQYYALFLKTL